MLIPLIHDDKRLFKCTNIAVTPIKLGYLDGSEPILPQKKAFQGIKFAICVYSYIFVCPVRLVIKTIHNGIYPPYVCC